MEPAAEFVAAEAFTNVAKYARLDVRVTATVSTDRLVLTIEDDGVGGATSSPGSGLAGMQDREGRSGWHPPSSSTVP